MERVSFKTSTRREGVEVSSVVCSREMPETLEELADMFAENVILATFRKEYIIQLQNVARLALEDNVPVDKIQGMVDEFVLGAGRKVDPEKVRRDYLKALAAAKKYGIVL